MTNTHLLPHLFILKKAMHDGQVVPFFVHEK